MSGIEEVIAVVGGALIVIGCAKISKKIGIKINKRKLKKLLLKGFKNADFEMIGKAISSLIDYDSRNNSKKLNKYLVKVVNKHKDTINEPNLVIALTDLSKLDTIFDAPIIEEEEEVDNEQEQEQIQAMLDEQLTEITKRRKEVLLRRNQIQIERLGHQKRKQRRSVGKMG